MMPMGMPTMPGTRPPPPAQLNPRVYPDERMCRYAKCWTHRDPWGVAWIKFTGNSTKGARDRWVCAECHKHYATGKPTAEAIPSEGPEWDWASEFAPWWISSLLVIACFVRLPFSLQNHPRHWIFCFRIRAMYRIRKFEIAFFKVRRLDRALTLQRQTMYEWRENGMLHHVLILSRWPMIVIVR
jgi:hypothetical protein